MKKLHLGVVAGAGALLLLTGCGGSGNKVNCTANFEQEGHKYTAEMIADLDSNDKVKDLTASMKFETEEDAEQFYSMYQAMLTFAKQFAEEGQEIPEIDIKRNGKTITISDYASLAKLESDEDSVNFIGMSKDEFIKEVKAQNENGEEWTCK